MTRLNKEAWLLLVSIAVGAPAFAAAPAACRPLPAAHAPAPAPATTPAAPAAQPVQQVSHTAAGEQSVLNANHVFTPTSQPLVQPVGFHSHSCMCQAQCQPAPAECPAEEEASQPQSLLDWDFHQCFGLFKENGDPWTLASMMGDNPPFIIAGWSQFGYTNNTDGIFNTHPHHFDWQQAYLYAERVADGSDGFDYGGRIDVLYGTDAQNTQAFGNNPGRFDYLNGWDHGVYGWAMPQLYAEVAYKDLSVKLGHFYTLLGYQVVPATGNFFYSIPFTFNFSEAFTHTGALGTYKASDDVTVYAGWTAGWDTGFDRFNGGSSFLGGTSLKVTDDVTLTYILTAGNLGWIGDGYTHSIVVDWIINDKWEYVFQSDNVRTNFHPLTGGSYDTIGINQYLYYQLTPKVKAGGRVEWWKADGVSFNEITAGFNYLPHPNLRIRPEIRYQWSPAGGKPGNNPFGIPLEQTIFGVDAIFTF